MRVLLTIEPRSREQRRLTNLVKRVGRTIEQTSEEYALHDYLGTHRLLPSLNLMSSRLFCPDGVRFSAPQSFPRQAEF
jgi:hypothetical protein